MSTEDQFQNVLHSEQNTSQDLSTEMCISVLQEMVDALLILKSIGHWPDIDSDIFEYDTPEQRFKKEIYQQGNVSESLCPQNFSFITIFATNLLEELKHERSYLKFSNSVSTIQKMQLDEELLLGETSKKEIIVKKLQMCLDSERDVSIDKLVSSMESIGKIKDQIENFYIQSEIKINYLKSWENSKLEMQEITFSKLIEEITEDIKTTEANINQDIRVHEEIEIAMSEIIQYAKRQQEIDDYKKHKIEQERLRLEKEEKNKKATTIQAWWRGVMVRKGFGKFRKKKEKKGKKKSTDKKEKK
ncbi:dynein regulatory complex protein 9-like isoform X2 [Diabrotica virgifera virgifera]|uniref:Dynein regulatory complex protein 9 n=1 Tax=Diabrotica virgifera virgifera TaxID=50390 RepID=A0A6P7GEY9_DIAVI|nr:dynein regulatory complex protein 9-like isoform X2 [Diabrotica virgifera virgifera]